MADVTDHNLKPINEYSENIAQFMRELIDLQRELADLERDVIDSKIRWRTLIFRSKLIELNERYSDLSDRIVTVSKASVDMSAVPEIERVPSGELTDRERAVHTHLRASGEIDSHLNRISTRSESIDRRLTAKVDTANTRLGLVISVTAILVSTAALAQSA